MLLLWLSIICIIPFDLAKLDGSTHISDKKSVVNGILDTTLVRNFFIASEVKLDIRLFFIGNQDRLKNYLSWVLC